MADQDFINLNGGVSLAQVDAVLGPYARLRFDSVDGNNKFEFIEVEPGMEGFRMGFFTDGNWDKEVSTP